MNETRGEPIRLNLGAGAYPLAGYVNLDIKAGTPAYPLAYEAETVDEVRASHVLEHYSHRDVQTVVNEWARVLKPGGILRVAVPNFKAVASLYAQGRGDLPLQGWIMGGQEDADDAHHCLFEPALLSSLLTAAGLVNVREWTSELQDCAAQPISLNLMAEKPGAECADWSPIREQVRLVATVPRLMFTDATLSLMHGVQELGVAVDVVQGAFWGHCMQMGFNRNLDLARYILTWDYDTVFTTWDVIALWRIMERHPNLGAVAGLQMRREMCMPLFNTVSRDGQVVQSVPLDALQAETYEVATAHFGLTLLRTDALRQVPKPWFQDTPDAEGDWAGGHVDDDIAFWVRWREAGNTIAIAPGVLLGHLQQVVTWPGPGLTEQHQPVSDYRANGRPRNSGVR